MSELHRSLARHGHGDRFLDLIAGLQVWCERLDALLARDAKSAEPAPPEAVDLMLGLIALRRKFGATLASESPPPPAIDRPTAPSSESLLR